MTSHSKHLNLYFRNQIFIIIFTFFRCEVCGFQCRQRASLKYHMTKHKAEADLEFECLMCRKRFEKAHNLNVHMSMVHPLTQAEAQRGGSQQQQQQYTDLQTISLTGEVVQQDQDRWQQGVQVCWTVLVWELGRFWTWRLIQTNTFHFNWPVVKSCNKLCSVLSYDFVGLCNTKLLKAFFVAWINFSLLKKWTTHSFSCTSGPGDFKLMFFCEWNLKISVFLAKQTFAEQK